jgi:hypothetical protein
VRDVTDTDGQDVACSVCGSFGSKPYLLASIPATSLVGGEVLHLCDEHSFPLRALLGRGRGVRLAIEADRLAPMVKRPKEAARSLKIYTAEELDDLERRYLQARPSTSSGRNYR